MPLEQKSEIDGSYGPEQKCRWSSYNSYKVLVWAWMMNEITVVFSPVEISHNGFYAHAALQTLAVLVVGMPLAYSEICVAQYTHCNIFTMWNFFPLFRNVGYGTLYLIWLKTIHLLVLASWYLVYSFYAALDVPPWLSCDDYGHTKCMVKRVNVSVFQHCLEAQILFEEDCGMKTASNCFFEREIGDNSTIELGVYCLIPWKTILALISICMAVFILSIKKEKVIQVAAKISAFYVSIVILVLFCVALSTNGTWYATKISINWSHYNFLNCYSTIARGFLSVGTGYGIIIFLTRDVSFRSHATMTAISMPLFSLFVTFMLALIAFSGIKTMSYYHGEEVNVLEIGTSLFFPAFASMTEILSYFDALPVWGFLWFSSIFFSLFINFWILYIFLKELLLHLSTAHYYIKLSCMFLLLLVIICTLPFLCSDVASILTDATEIIQAMNCLIFSVSLYWFYGIQNHNVDIIFMIGIKTNVIWKLAWLLNPIFVAVILYARWEVISTYEFKDSYYIDSISMSCDMLVLYILLSMYVFILTIGLLARILKYYRRGELMKLFSAKTSWGPKDKILFRSRKMFVPEIMTREFLYRQVRIRGYYKKKKPVIVCQQKEKTDSSSEIGKDDVSCSAMASN